MSETDEALETTDRVRPWTIKGIPPEERNAAIAAAEREGLTIGEWLTRAIRTQAQADHRSDRLPVPSRPGESHPEPLTDPDLTLSRHPARAIERRLPPSAENWGSSCCQLARSDVDDLLPLLHGHYPVSSLLWSSPPLADALVLSASRFRPLVPFPLASSARFSSSIREPE